MTGLQQIPALDGVDRRIQLFSGGDHIASAPLPERQLSSG